MLEACVESLESSFTIDSKIAVALNEGDEASQRYLTKKGIEFVNLPYNHGTLSVDYTYPFINSEYVTNVNDDMLFIKGWDANHAELIEKNHPASASCYLVEPVDTGNKVVVLDTALEDNFRDTDPEAFELASAAGLIKLRTMCHPSSQEVFNRRFEEGHYKREAKMVNYTHPITVKTGDFVAVGGYSANFDMGWWPGYGLDDHFALRLCMNYPEGFRFIVSDTHPVYHGMSVTNEKLSEEQKQKCAGYFESVTNGLGTTAFSCAIGRERWIDEKDGRMLYTPPVLELRGPDDPEGEDNE